MKLSLFVPCYNVAPTVISVLEKTPTEPFHEILLIDNGSTDGTRQLLQEYIKRRGRPFRLFFNEQNYSLGGSSIIAFREAIRSGSDFLICMHSDGQADPKDLEKFFPLSAEEDFVFGSRFLPESKTATYSPLRRLGNLFFTKLQEFLLRQPFKDIGAFVAFNLKTISALPYYRIKADMGYHPTLVLYTATQKRIHAREFPIYWGPVLRSEVNIWSYGLTHLLKILKMRLGLYKLTNQRLEAFVTKEIA